MNRAILLITLIFILMMVVAWFFYFHALKYVKKKSFWLYTGIGPIIIKNNIKKIPEPGRTYFKISLYIFGISIFSFIVAIILLKLLGFL